MRQPSIKSCSPKMDSADAIIRQLPVKLRTQHWYNDLHHSMFLILFADLREAMTRKSRRLVAYYIDMLTVYWIIHSLMEEEGMAHAMSRGVVAPETVASHARAHVALTKRWHATVFAPFKQDVIGAETLRENVVSYFGAIIDHIATSDMDTYGPETRTPEQTRAEVAHIAACGLPLSPLMPGAAEVMRALAPYMTRELGELMNVIDAVGSLKPLSLSQWSQPLWGEERGAFRDIVHKSLFRPALIHPSLCRAA